MAFVFVPPVIVSFSVLGVAAYYAKISHEKESLVDKESIKCQNRAREALFACKAASSNCTSVGHLQCTREYESALRENAHDNTKMRRKVASEFVRIRGIDFKRCNRSISLLRENTEVNII